MKLEWMGQHREFVEKIIKFGNSYAKAYKSEHYYNTPIAFSASQLQVLEYILENEERSDNMMEIAYRLGISKSTLSKHVKKMVEKGLLEKYHTSDNKKDVIIKVSDFGKEIYKIYAEFAYETAFKRIFEILDDVPREYLDKFTDVLDLASELTDIKEEKLKKSVELIRIE